MFKKVLSLIIYVSVIAGVSTLGYFFYTDPEFTFKVESFFGMAPCQKPLEYSLGTIDSNFNISDSAVLSALSDAAKIWDKAASKQLFEYSPSGKLKVNFIYDKRQATTDQLKTIGGTLDASTDNYQKLKDQYLSEKASYDQLSAKLNALIASIDSAKAAYESEVSSWNSRGGAPKNIYDQLAAKREEIQGMIDEANSDEALLSQKASSINSLVDSLNAMAKEINLNVQTYNRVGQSAGAEFDEGIYQSSALGTEIDIYQYKDRTQLVRVLAHELGHALGLEHVDDPKAIMNAVNQGTSLSATASDKEELSFVCHFK